MTPCQEVDPAEPISPYGESKLMIEWMLKSLSSCLRIRLCGISLFQCLWCRQSSRHGQDPGATHIIAVC
jgi:UDP-glucose 4-epimerase